MALTDSDQPNHLTYSTTDTFQLLVDKLNYDGDIYDSDLRYLDGAVGDYTTLTTTAKNLTDAINELDSDLFGAGGGSAHLELIGTEKTIVGAINRINTQFDPDFNGSQGAVDSDFTLAAQGNGSLLLLSDSDIKLVAGLPGGLAEGDIYLSTANKITFQKNQTEDRLIFDLSDSKINVLKSDDTYRVEAKDITLATTTNTFTFENVLELRDSSGEKIVDVVGNVHHNTTGTFNINFPGQDASEKVKINRVGGHHLTFDLGTGLGAGNEVTLVETNEPLRVVSPGVKLETGTLTAQVDRLVLQDSSAIYGGLLNNGGFLTIQNQDSDALRFRRDGTLNVAQFTGAIELPSSGVGSLHSDFDPVGSTQIHKLLKSINDRIPSVYDRDGNLLNPMV